MNRIVLNFLIIECYKEGARKFVKEANIDFAFRGRLFSLDWSTKINFCNQNLSDVTDFFNLISSYLWKTSGDALSTHYWITASVTRCCNKTVAQIFLKVAQ